MSELSLLSHLARHAEQRGDAVAHQEVAAGGGGRRLTYRQLWEQSRNAAAQLRNDLPAQSVILIACSNRIELPVAILSAWMAGCIAFPISADSAGPEIDAAARASGAKLLVTNSARQRLTVDAVHTPIRDTALLLKSSGTTGRPQIACRSSASLNAVCAQMVDALDMTAEDRALAVVPLSHSYGIEHGLLMPLTVGAAVHLCAGFDLLSVVNELDRTAITFLPGVPAMYEMLATVATPKSRWPSLRRAYSAGASLPEAVFESMQRFGLTVSQLYGATEIGSVTFNDSQRPGFDPRSVGYPMNAVEMIVVGLDDLQPLPRGEAGQLIVRAASMFSGYLDPQAHSTRDLGLLRDGFFATGDIASIDDTGRITISGRLSLLIDVGGLKVNPMEVEEILSTHAGVASCVVLPVRQSQTVCRIKAVIIPVDPADPPKVDSLRRFAREHLAAYKVPRSFEIRRSLPRTPTGKILRHLVDA